jgi:hypothetical protein
MPGVFFVPRAPASVVLRQLCSSLREGVAQSEVQKLTCHTNIRDKFFVSGDGALVTILDGLLHQSNSELTGLDFIHITHFDISLRGVARDSDTVLRLTYTEDDTSFSGTMTILEPEKWLETALISVLNALHQHFTLRPFKQLALDSLPSAERAVFKAQEAAVAELMANIAKFGTFVTTQSTNLTTFIEEKNKTLEAKFEQKESELLKSIATQKQVLEEREAALKQREIDLDLRNRTTTRRGLLKEIESAFAKQKSVELSTKTVRKRWVIVVTCVLAMFMGIALAFFGFRAVEANSHWFPGVPVLSSGILLAASTLIFFLKWNDAWFRDHARVEFQAMRNHSDILRASWVAELFFESKEVQSFEFPPALIDSLTKNLFTEAVENAVNHPSEDVLKTLGKIKLEAGSLKLNSDR